MADKDSRNTGRDGEVIRPVSYRPADESSARRFPLSPLQIALIIAVLVVAGILWFLFTAKSVRLTFDPSVAQSEITGGLRFQLGDVWLLRAGRYRLRASAPGYHDLDAALDVGAARNQTHTFVLEKLPGRVTITSEPPGAEVRFGDRTVGVTPTTPVPLPAGEVTLTFAKPRYQPAEVRAEIEGMERPQTITATLEPNWADVTITTTPPGAEIFIDDESTGQTTPAVVEVLAGEHEIRLKAPGHKSHRQRILVAAREQRTLEPVTLTRADSLLTVTTDPPGAGITLDGRFQGEAPVELAVRSGVRYRLQAFRSGYAPAERTVELPAGAERSVSLDLARLTGTVIVSHGSPARSSCRPARSRRNCSSTDVPGGPRIRPWSFPSTPSGSKSGCPATRATAPRSRPGKASPRN
jgi:hypothetical protein